MILHRWAWALAALAAVSQAGPLAAQGLDSPAAGEVEAVSGPIRSGEFHRHTGQALTADEVRFIVNESLAEQEKKRAEADKNKPHVVGSDNKLIGTYNNGFWLESAKKDFRMRVGGRTQMDAVWLDGNSGFETGLAPAFGTNYALQDSFNFRRARLTVEGTVHETMEWAVEYDFVNSINDNPGTGGAAATSGPLNTVNLPAPTDLWWAFTHVPVLGTFKIGNQKEPIGLEHLSSSRFLDFMERSFLQDAYTGPFQNGFSPGVSMANFAENERVSWQAGVYKNTQNVFAYSVIDAGYAFTGRMTWLPYWDEPSDGRYFMHLGASVSHRQLGQISQGPTENQIRIRSRASLRNGPGAMNPVLADTGVFFGDYQDIVGAEFIFQNGPLMFQSEYMASNVANARTQAGGNNVPVGPGVAVGDYFSHGYYFEVLYFLTGEHKAYNRKGGSVGRSAVVPYENAWVVKTDRGPLFGRGAWQMGLRYDQLDLRDTGVIDGGVIQDVTYGINWFINPRLKLQGNYVWTHRDSPGASAATDGDSNGWGMRMAHDF